MILNNDQGTLGKNQQVLAKNQVALGEQFKEWAESLDGSIVESINAADDSLEQTKRLVEDVDRLRNRLESGRVA